MSKIAQLTVGFMYASEIVPPEEVNAMTALFYLFEALGLVLVTTYLQYTQDVTTLIVAAIASQVVLLLLLHLVFIETPYFLFKKGRHEEYSAAMRYLAKLNGVSEY